MKIELNQSWSEVWQQRKFKFQLLASIGVLLCMAFFIPGFFSFVQQRNGFVIADPLLNALPPGDHSVLIFVFIYSALITAIISFSFSPWLLLLGLQSYCLLIVIRVFCIWIFPLQDPPGIIILNDPFVAFVGYGKNIITKDLFFSGHTSTLFLLFLITRKRALKIFFLSITIVVAILLLMQHVHYTIDVLAAPVFAWISYRICFSRVKN